VKIVEGQQKIKIVRTNRQSNLLSSCQSIFSLCRHHPSSRPNVLHQNLVLLENFKLFLWNSF